MQVCTSLQTDNHASTPPLSFLQAGCPSCRPTSSVKALKAMFVPATRSKTVLLGYGYYKTLIHRVPKKGDTKLMAVTASKQPIFTVFFTARFFKKFAME